MAPTVRLSGGVSTLASSVAPLASPTKRSYRPSPTSSPDPGAQEDQASTPRVLRTKLSNVDDFAAGAAGRVEVRLELKLEDVRAAAALKPVDEACTTPDTPPEEALPEKELVGLGMGDLGQERAGTAQQQDGTTQTATAERQTEELMRMPIEQHAALAKLCSQHWQSEYNTLKRAVAAAASETSHVAPLPAPPSYPPIPRVPSFPSSAASSVPRPSSAQPATRPELPHYASEPTVSTPLKQTARAPAAAQTTLTPALGSFAFSSPAPRAPPPSMTSAAPAPAVARAPPAAEAAGGLLADLASGEPITVERVEAKFIVKEAVPATLPVKDKTEGTVEVVPGLMYGMKLIHGVPVKTSVSHPINISPLVPPELLPSLSRSVFSQSSACSLPASPSAPFLLRPTPSTDLLTLTSALAAPVAATPATPKLLGNFVLSSCPGKKVRLPTCAPIPGAPPGRGAICRDVLLDLRRARDAHGVELVVCCLDDTELAYLGVPYATYAAAAAELGIEVVRLPMVEGFAPASPAALDAHLGRIVKEYTLKGRSVLSHCRGGIGRAGLVASCWMLKMGFVSTDLSEFSAQETMKVVERTVELIRRRRSVKAIETAHQVHFLVQYVQYLQQHGKVVDAADLA
ncbi:hypothetical protein JCM10213_004170 [Rhodosporidiobolus nylandii]